MLPQNDGLPTNIIKEPKGSNACKQDSFAQPGNRNLQRKDLLYLKKIISLTLCLSMVFSMMIPATFAYQDSTSTESVDNRVPDIIEEEIMLIYDEDGTIYEVPVTVSTYFPEGTDVSNYLETPGISTYGLIPDYPIGTVKRFSPKIDFATIGAVSGTVPVAHSVLTLLQVRGVSGVAADVVVAALGSKALLDIAIAGLILGWLSGVVVATGFHGVIIHVDMVYTSHYLNSGGYYMYGWDVQNAFPESY